MTILDRLLEKKRLTWFILESFVATRASHGVHDMAVEVQAIERAIEILREHDEARA